MSINRVVLVGYVTSDPQPKKTSKDYFILPFSLAVNEKRKNSSTGEWEDYVNYINCTFFGPRAEAVSSYIRKGSRLGIDGKLRYSSWEQDGQKRSYLSVIVNDVEFLNYVESDTADPSEFVSTPKPEPHPSPTSSVSAHSYVPDFEEVSSVYDDDIPF